MKPAKWYRRRVRDLLRAGHSREDCERFLAWSELIITARRIYWTLQQRRSLNWALQEYYGSLVGNLFRRHVHAHRWLARR